MDSEKEENGHKMDSDVDNHQKLDDSSKCNQKKGM